MNNLKLGDIFTPIKYAKHYIEKFDLLNQWLNGKTILDPTMGSGNILEAFVELALEKGYKDLPIKNLIGVELNKQYFEQACNKFLTKFGKTGTFFNSDILENNIQADIIFGNPPWKNFTDIDLEYRETLKKYFKQYNLISKNLLLGNSRIDICALIIQKTIQDNLKHNGIAIFFAPLSLIFNVGANNKFREFNGFALKEVYDLKNVFENISTRYGLLYFKKDEITKYPVKYFKNNKEEKLIQFSSNILTLEQNSFEKIQISKSQKPRQGINTCGANDIYFFNEKPENIPNEFLYPLITSTNFKNCDEIKKWVVLPYDKNGKVLKFLPELLEKYFIQYKEKLSNRKGILLKASNVWWSMLGVGPYCFSKYKIIWESYGKNTFNPKIFEGHWQANQALQSYIPCNSLDKAKKLLEKLKKPEIEKFLKSFQMDGCMNWAQPGKISLIFDIIV